MGLAATDDGGNMLDTTFENGALEGRSLPEAGTINFKPLDANHANILMIGYGLAWLALTTGWITVNLLGVVNSSLFPGYSFLILPPLPVPFIVILCRLSAERCGYALRERDVHYKNGIVWRNEASLPFNRIQHVEVERGPLERFFGLSTLKFFAAGGGSADLKIPSLPEAEAANLRAYILEKAGADHDDA